MPRRLPRYSMKLLPIFTGLMAIGPFALAPLLGNLQLALIVSVLVPPVLFVAMLKLGWVLDERRFLARAVTAKAIIVSKSISSVDEYVEVYEFKPDLAVFFGLEIHLIRNQYNLEFPPVKTYSISLA